MSNEVSLLFIRTKDERNSKVFSLEINWYAMNLSTIWPKSLKVSEIYQPIQSLILKSLIVTWKINILDLIYDVVLSKYIKLNQIIF